MNVHRISPAPLDLATIDNLLATGTRLELSPEATERIQTCRTYLEQRLARSGESIYGINTGFGSLCDTAIPNAELEQLQRNLVMSHACGTGEPVSKEVVRLMLLFKIHALSLGHSGVKLATVQRLIDHYNHDCLPVVFEQGSLGASGDLAPLAHLALPLIGTGEVWYQGEQLSAEEALAQLGWEPLELGSKEGLALLNGTQFMSAFGVLSLLRGLRLMEQADLIAAASLDAFDARPEPFDPLIHQVRHQPGQGQTAERIRGYLAESEIAVRPKPHVQDPYSFRCIPQVHGATRDVIGRAVEVFINEVNSATDNPTIFPEADRIISAGNFHGQPLAVVLDGLAIALAELGSISERRTYKLISGQRGLPAFLIASPGLHSGLMIPQYTAASLVSQNKQLCAPASVDTIDSSNGQEDHVSMGANAATRTLRVIRNLETILAIEWLNATQALQFRQPLASSPEITALVEAYREVVPFVEADRPLYRDIAASVAFLQGQMHPGSFPSGA